MEDTNLKNIELIRKSVIVFMLHLFLILIFVDIAYVLIFFAFSFFNFSGPFVTMVLWVLYILKYVLQTYLAARLVMTWSGENYIVTDNHFICRRGILHSEEICYGCKNIRSVSVRQSWLGRMLNYGDLLVEVSASGGYHEQILVQAVTDPERLHLRIEQLV